MEDVDNRLVAAAVVLMVCLSGCGTSSSWNRHEARDHRHGTDLPVGGSTDEVTHTGTTSRATQRSERPATSVSNGALLQSDTSPHAENRVVVEETGVVEEREAENRFATVPSGTILYYGLTPAEKGVQRAAEDIAFGKMKILQYGMPRSYDQPPVDEQSGLPIVMSMGCMMSSDQVAELDAYNETMRREAAARNSKSLEAGR